MDEHIAAYLEEHVPLGISKEAGDIAKRVSYRQAQGPSVFEERLFALSVVPPATGTTLLHEELPPVPLTSAPDCGPASRAHLLLALEPQAGRWVTEFKDYLLHDTLSEEDAEVERVAWQATAYCLQDDELYRKRPNNVSLRCISEEQGCELLADIHGGDCGHHSLSRTLMAGGYRYLYVTIDKFTKWEEVEPMRTIPAGSAVKFIRGLICYTSVEHPQTNGQAEHANAEVLRGLNTKSFKKKREACGKGRLDELQSVMWSIRTTTNEAHR
ncbi:uncharacterized protein [Aegilops tauschii subsp. strangulata]|uniref:uncharacterized protein n=1 Tax=Aegilops tauschii subsp. strangulata TaxID=200361 RepID=UPI00098AE039|nr:uncharacterized protein LOC109746198 [Aegilops tauschii subsp. strangulata]